MRLIDVDAIPDIEFLVCDATSANGELDAYCRGMDKVMEVVKSMPTIEPERQKGEWLPDNNNYYEERFICSVCGRSYKVDTCMGKPMWGFCPNCGADMR